MATFESIASLNGIGPGRTGDVPGAGVYIDGAGNIFGTAFGGGTSLGNGTSGGTVYKIAYDSQTQTYGAPQAIVAFAGGADGKQPNGTLTVDGQGNILGTTQNGGPNDIGTVFKLTYNSGTNSYQKEVIANFTSGQTATSAGAGPTGNLYRDGAGNLYGTTVYQGPNNAGTVYKLAYNSGTGTYSGPTLVTTFDASTASNPGVSGSRLNDDLVADAAGNLYGTTQRGDVNGGQFDGGTVFKVAYNSVNGTYAATPQVLTSFGNGAGDPQNATGRLAVDATGNIYGTTQSGGAADAGTVFRIAYDSQTQTYSPRLTIAEFTGGADGGIPQGGLIVDAAGNLFGTTSSGGDVNGNGTVFKISYNAGTQTYSPIQTLHTFNGTDGSAPAYATLVADSQGRLYGTTGLGGTSNNGTVYRISDVGYVCFTTGTRIRTTRGEVPVEALQVGERAVTASGEHRAIRWIGHRRLSPHHQPRPQAALPVRIAAGAFGEGRPVRDLFVSPAHAIAVDLLGEVLIPACRLINGTTITQVEADAVTYWHVELDSHDILLAEGLPAESYLDCGNRRFFANAEATDLLAAPDARPEGDLPFCRPFHEAGPLVDLVRARLEARAEELGWRKVEEALAGLHLVADGDIIRPDVDGLSARFVLPASARDVRLVSDTSVPAHVVPGASDDRRLGVAVAALTLDDGLTGARAVAPDDARLGAGFHAAEGGARWTDGAALLPADLWDGCKGTLFLRVTLAAPALPRWIGPEAAGDVARTDLWRFA